MQPCYWVITVKVKLVWCFEDMTFGCSSCVPDMFFFCSFFLNPCGSGMCLSLWLHWELDCFRDKQGPSSYIHWNQILFMHQTIFLILGFASFGTYDLWGCVSCVAWIINTFWCFDQLLAEIGAELSWYCSDVCVSIYLIKLWLPKPTVNSCSFQEYINSSICKDFKHGCLSLFLPQPVFWFEL